MTILDILKYPDRFLMQPTRPVENIDGELQRLIADMAETMYAAPGVGLAAIQVGSTHRMLVFDDRSDDTKRQYEVIINPKLIESDGVVVSENEGCLSVPDYRSDVRRAARVLVEGLDAKAGPCGWKPRASAPSCCSTKSITWTASSSSTGSAP